MNNRLDRGCILCFGQLLFVIVWETEQQKIIRWSTIKNKPTSNVGWTRKATKNVTFIRIVGIKKLDEK